ncbi:MAG: hypothetical protein IJH12_05965 [Clostridia bacterium]|nr:hypothetical protein [Clostridia bacterium]
MRECVEEFEKFIEEQSKKLRRKIKSEQANDGFIGGRGNDEFEDFQDFPMFGAIDKSFQCQEFQEEIFEYYVKDKIVDATMKYLLGKYNHNAAFTRDNKENIQGLSSTEYHEKSTPIDFFIYEDNKKIACSYFDSNMKKREHKIETHEFQLHNNNNSISEIDDWYFIEWGKNEDIQIDVTRFIINWSRKGQEAIKKDVHIISARKFFEKFFSIEEYNILKKKGCNIVEDCKNILKYRTLKKMDRYACFEFKENIRKKILEEDWNKHVYMFLDKHGDLDNSKSCNITCNGDLFIKKSLYKAILGTCECSKPFLTAEHNYEMSGKDIVEDYTSVICGYIKSVEQLCETIIREIIIPRYDDRLIIQINKKDKEFERKYGKDSIMKKNDRKYVHMKEEYKNYFKDEMTLNEIFYFFKENSEYLFDDNFNDETFACLRNYAKFNRNGYFHKDNIDDYNIVERIRNNTLWIICLVLTSIIVTEIEEKEHKMESIFGIFDYRFDKLFRKIELSKQIPMFEIVLEDGSRHKVLKLDNKKQDWHIDEFGFIQSAELIFIEVEEFPSSDLYGTIKKYSDEYQNRCLYNEKIFIFNRTNIPLYIYHVSMQNDESYNEKVDF